MATLRNPDAWAAKQRQRLERGKRSIRNFPERLKPFVRKTVIDLTSGTVKTATLRRLGHPFSRRHPKPLIPALPINVQTGRLRKSVRIVATGKRPIYRVQFTVPYAKYVLALHGTQRMVPRRFWQTLIKRMKPMINAGKRKIQEAIKNE